MRNLKKIFPLMLLGTVLVVGGLSVVQAEPAFLGFAEECECLKPNSGEWGVLVPSNPEGSEYECQPDPDCYIIPM